MRSIIKTLGVATVAFFAIPNNSQAYSNNQLELSTQQPSIQVSVGTNSESRKAARNQSDTATYIVRLSEPSVANYQGGIEGLSATNPKVLGETRLNVNSKASSDYRAFLQARQHALVEHCEEAFGHEINVKYRYQNVFNGVALELTSQEAAMIEKIPGVISVERERIEMPMTDAGPLWIGAKEIYKGNNGLSIPGTKGEGAVVAILDTGINHDHPSFADIGGDGYDHTNPLGSGNYIPGSHCDANPSFCNDKLIGAWDMVNSAADPDSPEDNNGHGSHTASTAAGNVINDAALLAPTTQWNVKISGVAPHANIIAYDVCIDSCPGSALLAAVEQVVIDASALPNGIQSLNYSISGGNNPYNDAVELGFLNATAAGVYVATSAGNSGPGAATTGHNSPWVSATAAMTHNRLMVNTVNNLTSDALPLADIGGLGFTAGYGPATIINSADLEGTYPGSTLCGLGGLGSFIPPWPAGTFNGEIVACTRGTFGRVEKGANVLAAGAGGFILMDNGGGVVGDPHVLPGVHISQADGAALAAWLAANPNPTGSITGFTLDLDPANGDIMAGFSSRGPNSSIDVIKPDIGAPGVSILAAVSTDGVSPAPEFGLISGTSMASPHNAGSGALVSMVTDWTPLEIKSALMMTATKDGSFKEDGVTPTDPFDVGGGRIDLKRVLKSGLVLNETQANFLAADPNLGGDPKTLNIASMQDSNCVGTCSWTRTVTNKSGHSVTWQTKGFGDGAGLAVSVSPEFVTLNDGESADITITADTTLAPAGWSFGDIRLKPNNNQFVKLGMPVAVVASTSTSDVLSKTVDQATAVKGDILNYEITVANGQLVDTIDITDMLPDGVSYVGGSASGVITNGSEVSPLTVSGNQLSWSFALDVGGLSVDPSPAPFGYFSLASLGVAPFGCPGNCDDGGFILNVPSFDYNGESHTQVLWSVNGTIEAGAASGFATSFFNQGFPDASIPNNILAPFWTDMNLGDGGNWYVAVLTAGPDQFTVYEWENVPLWGDPTTYTFQIWVQNGTSNIWFVYQDLPFVPFFTTVGAENSDGTVGFNYYFNGTGTAPAVGTDLTVNATQGGTATATFQGEVTSCKKNNKTKVNRVNLVSGATEESAIAVTSCSN
jgi:uncharacterized repeat protein (TIGR01451 family)